MQQNQSQRNNPWGFQAMNWSQPVTRGPPPQQTRPNMNRFGSPPGARNMRPNFQPNIGQHTGPQNLGSAYCTPRLQNSQGMPYNGPQNLNPFQQGPRLPCQQGPQNNQNNFFNGPNFVGSRHNVPPRPNHIQGQVYNRHPNRQMQGPRPEFFRAPGGCEQRPQFHAGRQQHGEKKKKVNKRDLPENNKFYCDVCDRGYKDEDKYKLHCDQHEKCPKEGCTYIAAGKLVQLHIKLQHNSGMAKKIWSLESKEDIQKWIEERKKNFPTAANIEKKKAALAEKIARGEVIEEKYFGKMHRREDNRRHGRDRGRGRGGRRGGRGGRQQDMKRKHDDTDKGECTAEKQSKDSKEEQNVMQEAVESLGMFFAAASSDSSSSDTDDDDHNSKLKDPTGSATSTVPDVTAAGALGSLMTSYIESDESEEENISKDSASIDTMKNVTEKNTGETAVEMEEPNNNNNDNKRTQRQRNRGRQRKNRDKWNTPPKLDKSLLEKLLAKEIRQERNKIMQCVHFIVKNNFFDNVKSIENKS